jgi:hypothetical protein
MRMKRSEARYITLIAAVVSLLVMAAMLYVACTAHAYQGHAGCPSTVPPYNTATCAYHTNVSQVSAYTNRSHWVAFRYIPAGQCSPGPCTAWTPWVFPPKDGHTTLHNDSPWTMIVYDVELY